ncbi:BREX-1 system adenine-specific DNA-methyltransferase PglX, partial [Pseudorhodobacter aquimaris]|uniref:BREX-1 system adenine-specific DNA-methyltransferase PglX n=1 Tax=Pseudorhodobacter aquimaris TaxID=687412 RepID=UPI00067BEB11
FLFEQIDDFTELLMPEDLLSQTSILAELRKVMTEDACQDVEIIGWLYQFYISEKKDQVFAGVKKNVKITAENIPAATQLFTPHWIVRYLVENSLGRLWLLNRPGSKLAERMDYYIAPEEPETDFLKIGKPEEIKLCDPACGSGHMLTYAFDLLYAIYEEEGYEADKIPALILTHNLTGVEIDDRAGALAAFALAMKAAAKLGRRRFLRMEAKPGICVLQNVAFTDAEMQDVAAVVGKDLFTDELRETLMQFEQGKNFGSLIVPKLRDPAETLRVVEARDFVGDLLLKEVQDRVMAVLRMAEALTPKYHVVVANPPYMGARNMNPILKKWLTTHYSSEKTDLMTCFIAVSKNLTTPNGFFGIINLPSWMFLGTYSELREELLTNSTFLNMLHLGRGIFGSDFGTTAFCIAKRPPKVGDTGIYRRLFDQHVDVRTPTQIEQLFRQEDYNRYTASQSDFKKVPGQPISYWLSDVIKNAFATMPSVGSVTLSSNGIQTGDNDRFVRQWHEVDGVKSRQGNKWVPYNKGGPFRKWYGNNEYFVNWADNGREIKQQDNCCIRGEKKYFIPGITWSDITSGPSSFKYFSEGHLFDAKGPSAFFEGESLTYALGFLNSKVVSVLTPILNPSLSFQIGDFRNLPLAKASDVPSAFKAGQNAELAVDFCRADWDAYETSWDFTTLPLLQPDHRAETLEDTYTTLRTHWQGMTDEMQRLEEENNRIFIDAYGLQDELTPEVPLNEITLTCNPAYRYGIKNDVAANEARLRADTMAEFLSYAVGCMFGRYSLDAPGLILANQGETLADYLSRVPEPSFMPDKDNVIPVLDADWFADDITDRFRQFLRVSFGEDTFRENLRFIEDALGKDIRKYFTKDFYGDHV